MKKKYVTPQFSVFNIDIEYSLCTGSSTMTVSNDPNDIQEEWEMGEDDERFINW